MFENTRCINIFCDVINHIYLLSMILSIVHLFYKIYLGAFTKNNTESDDQQSTEISSCNIHNVNLILYIRQITIIYVI